MVNFAASTNSGEAFSEYDQTEGPEAAADGSFLASDIFRFGDHSSLNTLKILAGHRPGAGKIGDGFPAVSLCDGTGAAYDVGGAIAGRLLFQANPSPYLPL